MPHMLLTALRMIVVTNVQTNRHVTVCTCVSEEIEEIKESKENDKNLINKKRSIGYRRNKINRRNGRIKRI